MLNNPLVLQQAEAWAKRVVSEPDQTVAQRIEEMYLASLGRPPSAAEAAEALAFVQAGGSDQARTWTEFAHVMFNLKEFIFVR
jgi:hypothetical protein